MAQEPGALMHQIPFFEPEQKEPKAAVPNRVWAQSIVIEPAIVESAARALFELVFGCGQRLDGKDRWLKCDEQTKIGFRREATAVIQAAWPLLIQAQRGLWDAGGAPLDLREDVPTAPLS
jgi:hypothetical protein